MILVGRRDVLYLLAPIAAMKLCSTFARGADEYDCEPIIICHSHDSRLTKTRVALDPDPFGVHRFVGLEIIQRAACTPSPGTQSSPIVYLPRLPPVDQTDDALCQSRAIISLNAGGH